MTSFSILVVEPHADDAFLSLGAHIERWVKEDRQVTILTVFSGTRKRALDAQAYAAAVGAGWVGLGLVEKTDPTTHQIKVPIGHQVILPLGLTHPEHLLVRQSLETSESWYYMDQPYALTQKNADLVTGLLDGKLVVSYMQPGARKYRHIDLFKDQAKFFHFNPEEKLIKGCELIVRSAP